jgi:hypothetical protein
MRALASVAIACTVVLAAGCGGASGGGSSCGAAPIRFQGATYHEEGSGMLAVADLDTTRQLGGLSAAACADTPGGDPGAATTYRLYAVRGIPASRAVAGILVDPDHAAQPANVVALWVHGTACGSSGKAALLACLHRTATGPLPMY